MKLTADMFKPSLALDKTRINVDPSSRRIAVRVASWDDVHSGHGSKVRMPRNVNVEAAHGGSALLADGSALAVANLPMGTLHADGKLGAEEARRVYEDTGRQVARVRYSLDEDGIRADGVLYEDVDQPTLDRLVASAPSGDWRTMTHIRSMDEFEHAPSDFVGAAIVNLPGFSGTFSQSSATPMRLVASADSMMLIEGTEVADETSETEELTDAADGERDECKGDGPCDGCNCDRKPAYSVTASGNDLESVMASVSEQVAALTAAADHGSMLTDETYHQLVERVSELEDIVSRAILAM